MEQSFFWSGRENNKEFESHIEAMINSRGLLVDVGCGVQRVHPSFVGVDAYTRVGSVVKAYMWDMPFEDNSVDGLTCMSALEHVSKFQVLPTLNEFARILKPGAKALIIVPDLIYCLKRFIENPSPYWEMDLIFGLQTHDGGIDEGEFHRTGFTEDIIGDYFNAVPKMHVEHIYEVEAYKQLNFGIVAVKE